MNLNEDDVSVSRIFRVWGFPEKMYQSLDSQNNLEALALLMEQQAKLTQYDPVNKKLTVFVEADQANAVVAGITKWKQDIPMWGEGCPQDLAHALRDSCMTVSSRWNGIQEYLYMGLYPEDTTRYIVDGLVGFRFFYLRQFAPSDPVYRY